MVSSVYCVAINPTKQIKKFKDLLHVTGRISHAGVLSDLAANVYLLKHSRNAAPLGATIANILSNTSSKYFMLVKQNVCLTKSFLLLLDKIKTSGDWDILYIPTHEDTARNIINDYDRIDLRYKLNIDDVVNHGKLMYTTERPKNKEPADFGVTIVDRALLEYAVYGLNGDSGDIFDRLFTVGYSAGCVIQYLQFYAYSGGIINVKS